MTHVLVAGAGLAGLSAARALEARGLRVTLIDARDRVGGRVWTIRTGFKGRQHAEGGADFIESSHTATLALARDLGLTLAPIIRHGFGYYGTDRSGRLSLQTMEGAFRTMAGAIHSLVHDYTLAERRWDSAIARDLARRSVASWLVETGAPDWFVQRVRGMRGLFLADPEDLSLLALVDFLADMGGSALDEAYRIREGNDRLATAVARRLKSPAQLQSVLRRIRQTGAGIVATIQAASGLAELSADYLVCTLPASTLRDVVFEPALPDAQRDAIARLRYGPATRLLLQFGKRFWTKRGRPNAFGSDQPTGAIWDGNEQQKGGAAILSLLAGGGASRDLQAILEREGAAGVLPRLAWLGRMPPLLASRRIVWESDPWALGGYAFFDPGFDPLWRDWLARPAGRVVFAGEHTSIRWQGYVNGAVETGLRAAAEIGALERS